MKRFSGYKFLLLAAVIFISGCTNSGQKTKMGGKYKFLVGTYTKKGSKGIYAFEFDPKTLNTTELSTAPKIDDPSFLVISKDNRHVYSVSESDRGEVVALDFDPEKGTFKTLNTVASGGAHPCHISLDKTGKWVLVGNYTGGNLSVIPVLPDGNISESIQTIQHTGKGPDTQRQEKPHVHSVNISPDNKDVYVADLGTDKIMAYRLDESTGKLSAGNSVSVSAGSGPRHFVFHPEEPFAYVIQELTGKVTAFKYTDNQLEFIEEISTLPAGFTGNNSCADIHISPDGKFLYGSNRFHDTLVIFEIDQKTGKLTLVGHQDVLGKTPRNFAIDPTGKFVFVANQDTDNIVIFRRDLKTGKLTPTGREVKVSMPICVKFLN
jgi:6-phosphogluconolactonase